jgi:hypothetical protein
MPSSYNVPFSNTKVGFMNIFICTKHTNFLCVIPFACVVWNVPMVTSSKLPFFSCIFSGTVMRRWRHMSDGCRSDIELVLKANHLQVCNDQRSAVLVTSETRDEFARFWEGHSYEPLVARNHILASICPQVSTFYVHAFPPFNTKFTRITLVKSVMKLECRSCNYWSLAARKIYSFFQEEPKWSGMSIAFILIAFTS